MRVGLRILGTGDQYLRVRENTLQFRNERNRATFALIDRSHAKRLFHGVHGVFGSLGIWIHGPTHAIIKLVDPHFGAKRSMLDHEPGKSFLSLFRTLVWSGAQAETERRFRGDHVERSLHWMSIEADDGHARLGPQTCGQRTGAGQTVGIDDAGVRTHGCLIHISLQSADWIF